MRAGARNETLRPRVRANLERTPRQDAVDERSYAGRVSSQAASVERLDTTRSVGSVLVVDDDPDIRALLLRVLQDADYDCDAVSDGRIALERLAQASYDVIITDIRMPSLGGLELLRAIREHDLDVPVILLTGMPDFDTAVTAVEYGAFRYLVKPVDLDVLLETVARALTVSRIARLRREAIELVGSNPLQLGDRASLDARFSKALDALWMAFQPIVHLPSRTVLAYEALARSDEPSLPTPAGLFDAAERLDRAHDLGRATRARVAAAAADAPSGVLLFVNVNAAELNDNELISQAAPLSAMSGRVVIEVTERSALDRVDGLTVRRRRLRELGFRIAVDDLGAGYAGLSSFSVLDPEFVKLDMSLVRGVDTQPRKLRIVEGIASLCSKLGLSVVCEGVETREELVALTGAGIELFQGYFFARPARGFPEPRWP